MGGSESTRSGQHRSGDIPRDTYEFFVRFEERMDARFKSAREQTKEDISNALKIEVIPALNEINDRLERGDERFKAHDERLDEHSDRIKKPLRRDNDDDTAALDKRDKNGWIRADKLPAMITAIISTVIAGTVSLIFALRGNPAHPAAQPQPAPTVQPAANDGETAP